MQGIIGVVLPFFAVVGVGYLAARWKLIGIQGNQGLSTFVYWFAIPALLFKGVATRDLAELADVRLLVVYALSTVLLFLAVRAIAARLFGLDREYAIFHGFGAAQSNNGFLAVPLMPALFGQEAIAPLALTLFADMLILYPLAFVLADLASGKPHSRAELARNVARTFYTNPFVIGLGAGLVVAIAKIPLPATVMSFVTLLGNAGPTAALFALGAALALHSAGSGATSQIALMNAGKLVIHPILVAIVGIWIIPLSPLHLAVGIAVAALPTGINLFLISQRYVPNVGVYSAAILSSTAIAIVTLSGVVWLVQR